jgi:hypothetical protein
MNGLTHGTMSGRSQRWRAWARSFVLARPFAGFNVLRRRGPVAMALRRRGRTVLWMPRFTILNRRFEGSRSISFEPRISLTLAVPAMTFHRTLGAPIRPFAFITALHSTQANPSDSIAYRGSLPIRLEQSVVPQTLLQEIATRTRRIEERVRVEIVMAVRTSTAHAVAAAEAQDLSRRSGPDWWKAQPPARPHGAATVPTVNVDEIAENVMRRLDQRVTAFRERMGRH